MNATAIEQDLDRHSLDTGIPKAELKRICLRAGLDQLQRGELKVRAEEGTLPIYLPSEQVTFLREICEAAGIDNGAEGFVGSVIGDMIEAALNDKDGVPEIIMGGWDLSDPSAKEAAMHAVIDRWNAEKEGGEP